MTRVYVLCVKSGGRGVLAFSESKGKRTAQEEEYYCFYLAHLS
jgi:hypothetical protein